MRRTTPTPTAPAGANRQAHAHHEDAGRNRRPDQGRQGASSPGYVFRSGRRGGRAPRHGENRGSCTINGGSGVAYGFDARGRSAKANKHGEHYVAFEIDKPIEPGKKEVISEKLRYADDVTEKCRGRPNDETTCSNGRHGSGNDPVPRTSEVGRGSFGRPCFLGSWRSAVDARMSASIAAVQIVRKEVIEKDDKGVTTAMTSRPSGMLVRAISPRSSGAAKTSLRARTSVTRLVPVIVKHFWDARGYYRWDIERLGDCERPVTPTPTVRTRSLPSARRSSTTAAPSASTAAVARFGALLKRCPWMARN